MKFHVRIEDHLYEVEIADLHARPVKTLVDGVEIEVWPEEMRQVVVEETQTKSSERIPPQPVGVDTTPESVVTSTAVRAPIPGVIVSIAVNPGGQVAFGQELCILEAMKMRNAIRAGRAGQIAVIHITPGQTVNHHDLLMEFAE